MLCINIATLVNYALSNSNGPYSQYEHQSLIFIYSVFLFVDSWRHFAQKEVHRFI